MSSKKNKKINPADAVPCGEPGGFFYRNRFILLAFVVPCIVMITAFAMMKVSPFGDKQILEWDLWHQYFPFLVDFQGKLKHGESLFWSWTQGGGTNYLALISYYLVSPFNFLSVFFPSQWLQEYLMFTVAIRIALAGMFMAIFLRSVYKRNDFSLVIFGCCFSFCAFFMGYYWNTIWLDAVCLTPLVALGTVRLLTENKFRLYTVTLALSLLTNYYIGFFTCIFVLLIFIAYHIVCWKGLKPFLSKLVTTGVFSLIAIGMTAFLLLPAYMALGNTYASGSSFPTKFAIKIGASNDLNGVLSAMVQVFSNFLNFVEPSTAAAKALPNIACGTATVVLGILFLTNGKIASLRERIVSVCLIIFMLLSCVIRQLDYIWHGFHFTNMVPYRFTYLVSFLLVVMAFRVFIRIADVSRASILAAAAVTVILILFGINTQKNSTLIASAVIAAAVLGMIFLCARKTLPRKILVILLALIVIGQSVVTAYFGIKTVRVTSMDDYPRGGEVTADIISHMNELEQDTPELWRVEMTSYQTTNDSSLNGYHGLSTFSSMITANITQFFENFGMMGWKEGNRGLYAEGSPVTNTFMNLKYLITRDGAYGNTYDLTEVYENSNKKLLLNEHYIPMGFMVNDALRDWTEEEDESQIDPFLKQNEFFRLATGLAEDVYSPLDVVSQGHSDDANFPVDEKDYGEYSYDYKKFDGKPKLKWDYEVQQDGIYCMYADIAGSQKATVLVNGDTHTPTYNIKRPYIACIGAFHAGDTISVTSELDKGTKGSAKVYVQRFNEDVFEKGYEIVSRDVMTTTKLSGNRMEGTIDVSEDGLFYTSIPYEKGWTAVVDGQEVEVTPVGGSMLAFPLTAGTHTIQLHFIPNGLWVGLAVSLICLAAFAAACAGIYDKIRKSK